MTVDGMIKKKMRDLKDGTMSTKIILPERLGYVVQGYIDDSDEPK